ncbi:MAG TPA: ABC transporter permease [Lachnospiraceae bacterium]|nr:ABC transporter permease [Lachnospiraceae bacterium]
MRGIGEIFKKEIARVVKDRKMLFSVFLLPALLMVGIMSLTSNLVSNMEEDIDSHVAVIYVSNMPESFQTLLDAGESAYDIRSMKEEEQIKEELKKGEADLWIEFPENLESQVENYREGDRIPQVKVYYNPSEDYSSAAYQEISGQVLEGYRQMLLQNRVGNLEQLTVFTVNSDNPEMVVQDDKKANGKALGMMLPYFITILLFAGAMGIGTDMIAGEKERGTMASLLVSPVKRSSIVLGKVFALMVISGISSLIYVVVMVASMPLMSKAMAGTESGMKMEITLEQGVMLAGILIALAFLYSTLIILFSVFAKSTKEASTYVMPAYLLVLVIGLMSMFTSKAPSSETYFIPLYNSAIVLKGILSDEVTWMQFASTLLSNLALGAVLTGVIVKAFERENVMAP